MAKAEEKKLKRSLKARSLDNYKNSTREIKKTVNSVWDYAAKSPMLKLKNYTDEQIKMRKANAKGKVNKKGEAVKVNMDRPLNKLINSKSFQILLSGAAAHASTVLREDAYHTHSLNHVDHVKRTRNGETEEYETKVYTPEASKAPILPTISKGAQILIEQVVCAYAQEAALNAIHVKEALRSAIDDEELEKKSYLKRLNGEMMKIGFNETDKRIFASVAPLDRMYVLPKLKVETKMELDKETNKEVKKSFEVDDDDFIPDAEEPEVTDDKDEEMEPPVDDDDEDEEIEAPDEEETEDEDA
tara:strand:- start:29 stop:931 length:903 start_codon:yes stop_codon:yes gene_type:complete